MGLKTVKTLISFDLRKYYENMLARSECTTKHENKASYNTDYIVPDLIYIYIYIYILLTKTWFVVGIFHEFPEYYMEK